MNLSEFDPRIEGAMNELNKKKKYLSLVKILKPYQSVDCLACIPGISLKTISQIKAHDFNVVEDIGNNRQKFKNIPFIGSKKRKAILNYIDENKLS